MLSWKFQSEDDAYEFLEAVHDCLKEELNPYQEQIMKSDGKSCPCCDVYDRQNLAEIAGTRIGKDAEYRCDICGKIVFLKD